MQQTIVTQAFEDFLRTLESEGAVDEQVIKRLREALLDREEYRTDDLRAALFSEEELP